MLESFARRIERCAALLSRISAYLAGILILVMIATIMIDVIGRAVFNKPLPGGVELNRTMLVVVVFFGLAITQLAKGHIRVDILLVKASRTKRLLLDIAALVLAVVTFGLTTWMTVPVTIEAIRIGEYETGIISFPMWPARLFMTIGLAIFTFQLLADLLATLRSGRADERYDSTDRAHYE